MPVPGRLWQMNSGIQSMAIPFLEPVDIKTKQRDSTAASDCQASTVTYSSPLCSPLLLHLLPHPSAGKTWEGESLWINCRAATRSAGQDEKLPAEVKTRRVGERREARGCFSFILCSLSPSITGFLQLSLSLSRSQSYPVIGMQDQAFSVLQCGFVSAVACQKKRELHCRGGCGEHTPTHAHHRSIKTLVCIPREAFLADWVTFLLSFKLKIWSCFIAHSETQCLASIDFSISILLTPVTGY